MFIFSSPAYTEDARIYNFPADTTIHLKVIPKRENYIYYQYNDVRGFNYRRVDTVIPNTLQDEFEMDVALDTATFKPI